MTILIGLKVCEGEGEGGAGGGRLMGKIAIKPFYSLLQNLKEEKLPFLLEYFPQSSPVLVVCYVV